jgi:ubiquinone/menaquinone biosynthesis C-methylase UbiE
MNTPPEQIVTSSDQAFYDQEPLGSLEDHAKWMREIEFYFHGYADRLNSALAGTGGYAAELGAGSCGLSVCLSRLENVKRIASLDISMIRMQKMIDLSATVLGGDRSKIQPIACDFNGRLPFADGELDAVVFDAALHHTRSMWATLGECNRVLRTGGILVAQRESYLSALRSKKQIAHLLESPEVAANVSENMYLLEQYVYYLKINRFSVQFVKRTQGNIKSILSILNGLLFTDGVLLCKKR